MNECLIPILKEGFSMMLIGMGTVLTFLCIMIIQKLNQIFPEPVAQPAGGRTKKTASSDDAEIAAAVVAAMFSKK